jgi:hypothetical protein
VRRRGGRAGGPSGVVARHVRGRSFEVAGPSGALDQPRPRRPTKTGGAEMTRAAIVTAKMINAAAPGASATGASATPDVRTGAITSGAGFVASGCGRETAEQKRLRGGPCVHRRR